MTRPFAWLPHGRSLFLVFFLSVLSASALTAEPAANCPPGPLKELPAPGENVTVAIQGGQTHCYRLPGNARDRLAVLVQQRHAANIRFDLPDGTFIDSPLHYSGDEIWFSAAHADVNVLRVTSLSPRAVRETYSLAIEWLNPGEIPLATRWSVLMRELAARKEDSKKLANEWRALSEAWHMRERLSWAALAARIAGRLWWHAGDSARALQAYETAFERYQAADDTVNAAQVLNDRALLARDLARFDEAISLLEQALEQQRRQGDQSGIPTTLNNLGLIYHYQGELEQARTYYEQAAALNRELDRPHSRLAQLNNLGGIHFVRGESAAAAAAFREVAALGEALEVLEAQAAGLGNLGLIQMNSGAYLDALATYERLLGIYRTSSMDRLGEARTLDRIGQTYMQIGDPVRGIDYLEQARAQRMALDDRQGLAQTLRHLATAQLGIGNRDAAHAAIKQARALQPPPREAALLDLLSGRVLMRQGDFAAAAGVLAGAAEQLSEAGEKPLAVVARIYSAQARVRDQVALDEDELRAFLPVLQEAGFTFGEIHLRHVLALNAFRQGRLAAALAELKSAQQLVERVRNAIPLPALRASYAGSRARLLDLHIAVLMALHARDPDSGHARQALRVSEQAKARGLLELLQAQDVQPGGRAAGIVAERRALLQQINFRISRTGASAAADSAQLAEWRARLDVLEAELARISPLFGGLLEPSPADSLSGLRDLLGTRGALLHYHLGEYGSYAWVVTREDVFVRTLPAAAMIGAQVQAVRDALERRTVPAPQRAAALRALSDSVWRPVAGLVSSYPALFVVAGGALHLAPFAVLPGAAGEPLIARHALRMLPSAGVGIRLAERDGSPASLQISLVGDPVYDANDPRLMASSAGMNVNMTAAGRLPATARELRAVAAARPAAEVRVFNGFAARPDVMRETALATADIVHFAVHGVFDSDAPALSGLLLSRFDANGEPGNGFVGLRDIYALDWNAALVVLSGCETARGRQLDGVGVVGMTSGFLAAGAAQTVSSLWRIPDTATAKFMRHFYEALENLNAAAALREAQLKMRKDRRWRHPYFWSGFVVHGMTPGGSKHAMAAVPGNARR